MKKKQTIAETLVPGKVELDGIILRTESGAAMDIKPSFVALEIYESIYSNYLEGSLTIEDTKNIRSEFSFTGNETVEVSFRSPKGKNIRRVFQVVDIGDQVLLGKGSKAYSFGLVSMLYKLSIGKKISKSFVNQERALIVKAIYEDLISEDSEMKQITARFQKTDGTTSIVIPYWNHLFAINRIAAQSELDGANDFLFFETLDSVNYISISSLKESAQRELLTYSEGSTRKEGDSNPNWELEKQKILNYSVSENYNSKYSKLFSGELSGENMNFDMTRKRIRRRRHAYINEFLNIPHIEKSPIIPPLKDSFSSKFQAKLVKTETSSFLFDNVEDNNNILSNYFKRNSHLSQMNLSTLNLLLYGDTSRGLGDIVEIEIPNVGGNKETKSGDPKKQEKYLSGRYMITSIGHHISRDEYMTSVDVARDSLPESIPDTTTVSSE